MLVAQYLIDGLALGSVYAVLALSYTLVFGVIRMVNFAQGELITLGSLGGVGAWALGEGLPSALRVALLVLGALAAAGAGGLLMERTLFRPLLRSHSPPLLGLIASLGVSIALQNLLRLGVSSSDLLVPQQLGQTPWTFAGVQVAPAQLLLFVCGGLLTGLTYWLVHHTRFGLSVMAVRDNPELAEGQGINLHRVMVGLFLLAGLLAGAGGLLMGEYYGLARYDMGFLPGIKAFTASIMGGVGNVVGGALAGLLLGVIESFGAAYVSSDYKDGFAFLLLVLVLMFRPQGLLRGQD